MQAVLALQKLPAATRIDDVLLTNCTSVGCMPSTVTDLKSCTGTGFSG